MIKDNADFKRKNFIRNLGECKDRDPFTKEALNILNKVKTARKSFVIDIIKEVIKGILLIAIISLVYKGDIKNAMYLVIIYFLILE